MVGLNMPPLQNSRCLGDAIWEKRPAPMAKVQSQVRIEIFPVNYGGKDLG